MIKRSELVDYLDNELAMKLFADSSLNGLQFEGTDTISSVALAVDAGESVLQAAASHKASILIVHHGILWDRPIPWTGQIRRALEILSRAELNLYAAHLPLDAHPDWGNNFVLARRLSLSELRAAIPHRGRAIGCIGKNSAKKSRDDFAAELATLPGMTGKPLVLPFGKAVPEYVCVVTGSGMDAITSAAEEGFDTLVTGEPKQFAYHYAKDHGLNVICAGHYATETVGVLELGKALHSRFALPTTFIDIPTGI